MFFLSTKVILIFILKKKQSINLEKSVFCAGNNKLAAFINYSVLARRIFPFKKSDLCCLKEIIKLFSLLRLFRRNYLLYSFFSAIGECEEKQKFFAIGAVFLFEALCKYNVATFLLIKYFSLSIQCK